MHDSEASTASLAGVREGLHAAAALAADRREFAGAELAFGGTVIVATAFAAADHLEALRARLAGVREGLRAPSALAAHRIVLHGAGLRFTIRRAIVRTAFATVDHIETVGPCLAGIREGAHAIATLAAHGRIFHRADRRAGRPRAWTRLVDDHRTGGEEAERQHQHGDRARQKKFEKCHGCPL